MPDRMEDRITYKYETILDNMAWSYSSVNSFATCPHMFKLTYIDSVNRKNNFFSEYGLFSHKILENYFKDKLDIMELALYYENDYAKSIISPPPPYPAGMSEKYYNQGLEFFLNFDFDKEKYNIIYIEKKIQAIFNDIKLVAKPDLILKEKDTGKNILLDYKTSVPFIKEIPNMKKIDEYKKQLYLYSYFTNEQLHANIDIIKLWFLRVNKWYEFAYNEDEAADVVNWFYSTILDIKSEEVFPPCDIKKNAYFCDNLCSVKEHCKYQHNKAHQK